MGQSHSYCVATLTTTLTHPRPKSPVQTETMDTVEPGDGNKTTTPEGEKGTPVNTQPPEGDKKAE